MTGYTLVNVKPDTPEWERERRKSVGASEAAAVMGLSSYGNTPLDVYKHKLGVDRPFDPLLGWIGHQSEPIIEAWVHEFSGVDVELNPGFMARSNAHPYLHASFDRVSAQPFCTWQFKTAHHYSGHHWDEGVPTDIRVQVQAEMAVAGTPRAAVVVWIGGREFRLFWEPRDDRFINEHLLPTVQQFWDGNVRAHVPPEPSTLSELNEVYITQSVPIEASEAALEAVERRAILLSDIEAQQEEADALKLAIGTYMGPADTLTHKGRKVLTFKTQKGRASFDAAALKQDHPDLAAAYTSQGSPFRVMRTIKPKEQSK
ncbi:YqaJ viral recombinase family nuclease [Microbacterium allomyrinae]|uniref:YqaJ viral recombinase family protein n=1 Tax=Microbacterium allomyrinae TaxID=2830666 RepID=A0A9X1LW04_9MICO|nr:YqaJ viral recombinase family protein [Microbacterium allomyrinae]MCC2033100.1 YqaJ viral recombinase family protein [Microbacterium allomyrinae]